MSKSAHEIWLVVIDCPVYEVSSEGRVRSIVGRARSASKPLKHTIKANGYHQVKLKNTSNFAKNFYVHRLVAQAFIDNPEGKPEINHRNGDPSDNRIENLEWVTSQENKLHRARVLKKAVREHHPAAKLTADDVREIRMKRLLGASMADLALRYGVTYGNVWSILSGKTWQEG